jgi:hypothetical protein
MNQDIEAIVSRHESELHAAVHRWMSDPSRVHRTVSGRRLQILSPGMLNPHEGPDFLGAAIMLDASVLTGSIEFDKRRSYWRQHGHGSRVEYRRVVLHAVIECDAEGDDLPETVVVPADELAAIVEQHRADLPHHVPLEEVQSYALARLLRMSTEHVAYFHMRSVKEGFALSVRAFLRRFAEKQRRPAYAAAQLDRIAARAAESEHARFLESLVLRSVADVAKQLAELSTRSIADEGTHLRGEIMTNCVLPSACVLASDADRIGVFTWYWSAPATCRYGVLGRRYPDMPQQYVWQQQGLLELMRRPTETTIGEIFRSYGTLVALDFYRSAEEPPLLEDER